MALTPADAVTRVQDNTGRPSTDQQCPAAVIARRLHTEYVNLHRRISSEFPTFYERTILANVGFGVAGTLTMSVALVGRNFSQLTDSDGHGNTCGFKVILTLDDASSVENDVGFWLTGPTSSSVNGSGVGIVYAYGGTATTFTLALPAGLTAGRSIVGVSVEVTAGAAGTGLTAATLTLKRMGGVTAELGTIDLLTEATTVTARLALYADPTYYGATWIGEPVDFESLRLLERLTGNGQWLPVSTSSSLNRRESLNPSFYEQGRFLMLSPDDQVTGQYRLTYETKVPDGYAYYDLPDGFEQIVIEETSAFVRQRHEEDPTYHKREAQRIWDDQYMSLWNRFGSHGRSGLNVTRE